MNKDQVVKELVEVSEEKGLLPVLNTVWSRNIRVSVPFSQRACDTNVDELEFSVRASNALKRAALFTVGDVIRTIENEELERIRNLGRKTVNEIKTRLLVFGYERLTHTEKLQFWWKILELRCE